MKLSWSGKLMAAAIGAKVAAIGLRKVAEMIPVEEPQRTYCAPAPQPEYVVNGQDYYRIGNWVCPHCQYRQPNSHNPNIRHIETCFNSACKKNFLYYEGKFWSAERYPAPIPLICPTCQRPTEASMNCYGECPKCKTVIAVFFRP